MYLRTTVYYLRTFKHNLKPFQRTRLDRQERQQLWCKLRSVMKHACMPGRTPVSEWHLMLLFCCFHSWIYLRDGAVQAVAFTLRVFAAFCGCWECDVHANQSWLDAHIDMCPQNLWYARSSHYQGWLSMQKSFVWSSWSERGVGHPSLHDFACPLNSLHRSWMVMVILKTGHCGTTIRDRGFTWIHRSYCFERAQRRHSHLSVLISK